MPEITNNTEIHIDSIIEDDDRETMIKVENVGMTFNMASEQLNSLKEYAIALFKRNLFFKELRALNDISFEVKKGDVYGIVGTNGSGKSTLLKIVAGVLEPNDGKVTINGSIAPLIELGAGFDMELTARENIYLNGALLGYSNDFIDEHFDAIVEFAEIDKFLDMPMKNYSSGMVARIAFAIATVIVPEILIVDEVLSVGDFMFQKKCEDRIQELIKDHGTTVLIVSHSIEQVQRLCNKAIWIEKGKTRINGTAEDVCSIYSLIGGRTGSLEAEKTIIDAHLKTRNIPSETLESCYYDTSELNYCDSCLDLVRQATPVGKTYDDVVLVSPMEHTYLCLGNSIAGSLNCPVLIYDMYSPSLALTTWLEQNKPSNIYILDKRNCKGTEKLLKHNFYWKPNIELFIGKDDENSLEWQINVLDYCLNKKLCFSDDIIICDYESNIPATTSVSQYAYMNKTPILGINKYEDNIESLKKWTKIKSFSKSILVNNPLSTEDKATLNDIIAVCDVNDSDLIKDQQDNKNDPTDLIVLPEGREIFQLNSVVAFFCCNRNAKFILIDNTNLDSLANACNKIASQNQAKLIFVQGVLRCSGYIVNLLCRCTKLNN